MSSNISQISKLIKPLRDIGVLTIALTLALVANFAYGQWANPTATPPAGNVTAPVNIGTSAQTKDGALGVNELTVFGRGYIESPAPTLTLNDTDTDHTSFWWHVNNSRTYLLADRNNDGSWIDENPWPLEIAAGPAASDDFLRVSNQVRAYQYCDRGGTNCVNASSMGGGSSQVVGSWCGFGMTLVGAIQLCDGQNPVVSCPAGYRQTVIAVMGSQGGNWMTCFYDPLYTPPAPNPNPDPVPPAGCPAGTYYEGGESGSGQCVPTSGGGAGSGGGADAGGGR